MRLRALLVYPWKKLNYLNYLKGIGDNQKSGLLELTSLVVGLVGKSTGGPSGWSGGDGSGVVSELDDGSLSVGSGRDDDDISGILDGSDGSGSELDLLPGLLEVHDPSSWFSTVWHVGSHVVIKALSGDVTLTLKCAFTFEARSLRKSSCFLLRLLIISNYLNIFSKNKGNFYLMNYGFN